MTKAGAEIEVKIRNIAVGGAGVGEVCHQCDGYQDLLGITAFVPFTAPGEKVRARVDEFKGRYVNATLLSVVEASPERVLPRCSVYGQCGGCELQHLSYQAQRDAKYQMILGSLRSAKFSTRELELLHPVEGGDDYAYRRRATLHIDREGKLGFYRGSSRSVVSAGSCPICVPEIQQAIGQAQPFAQAVKGKVSTLILDADDHGIVATIKSPFSLTSGDRRKILEEAKKYFTDVSLQSPEGELGGFGRQILDLQISDAPPISIRVPAGHFSQVNAAINRKLIRKTLDSLQLGSQQIIFDLYAGAGNFSIPLAKSGAQVYAVECDKRLVNFAKENAARYHLEKNLFVREASVERFLESPPRVPRIDSILADPPRSGLGPLAEKLPECESLILISCHLPSGVRDLKQLSQLGWQIEGIFPFDMFAQTSYVEVLSVLRKS